MVRPHAPPSPAWHPAAELDGDVDVLGSGERRPSHLRQPGGMLTEDSGVFERRCLVFLQRPVKLEINAPQPAAVLIALPESPAVYVLDTRGLRLVIEEEEDNADNERPDRVH